MTKLYFHEQSSPVSGTLPSTTQSGLTITESVDAVTVNRAMDDAKGLGPQNSKAINVNASTARTTYFSRFCSPPIKAAGTISANTWNYSFAAQQSATAMQFPTITGTTNPVRICCYVWRPTTGAKVGDILNANSNSDFGSTAATTLKCTFGTFAGSAVTVQAGDIICFEVIFVYTPTTGAKTGTYYYDGNTENATDGTVVTNHATYIETPQTLVFLAQKALTETIAISESPSIIITPVAGHNANVSTKKMTLTLDATGTVHDQAFAGAGFQPKAAIFWGCPVTANDTYNEGYSATYGFSDGTNNSCVTTASVDAAATLDNSCMIRNDACISILSTAAGNAELVRGKVKTFDSDGVTITWNVKNTTQYILHVLFIGGSDITNVICKQETTGTTSTGNKAYTGYGFRPDVLFFACVSNATLNTLTANVQFSIGAADSAAGQFAIGIWEQDAVSANTGGVDKYWFVNNSALVTPSSTGGFPSIRPALVTIDSDGYTVNHLRAPPASTYPFLCLAIKGGYWDVGSFQQRTSAGATSITQPVQANPEALMLIGSDATTVNTEISAQGAADSTISIGGADNTAEGYVFFGKKQITSPNTAAMISSTAKIIRNATPATTATATALTAEADTSDMTTIGQFAINYTTADATARYIGYVVLAKGPVATGQNINKTLTETTTLTGTVARLDAKARAISQTITISETPTRLAAKIRSLSAQTITIGETLTRIKGSVKTLTETITLTGTVARLAAKIRSRIETITIGESLNRLTSKIRTLSHTIAISEAATRLAAKARSRTETITISESAIRLAAKTRALAAQTISISDTVTRVKGKIKTLTETITISDSLTRLAAKTRTVSQSIAITESATRLAAKTRTVSQTIAITDSVARVKGKIKTLTETITVSDSVTRRAAKIRTITQTITISESLSKLATKIRSISQTISITDAVNRTVSIQPKQVVKTLTETITLSQTLARQIAKVRAISQIITITENAVRQASKIRSLTTQVITFADSVSRTTSQGAQQITRTITQTITISDSITRLTLKIRTIPQTITLSDATNRSTGKTRTVPTQNIVITDIANRTLSHAQNIVKAITELITFSDTLDRLAAKKRTLATQTISITDSVTRQRGKVRQLATQIITFSDSIARRTAKIRELTHILTFQDFNLNIFKNGVLIRPAQRPDKGGVTVPYKKPKLFKQKLKTILYPVYHVTELQRIERRRKLRQFKPIAIIPAFEQSINEVVAPFIVTDPIRNTAVVKFALADNYKTPLIFSGAIPIKITGDNKVRLNKAKCEWFVMSSNGAHLVQKQHKKIQRLAKLMAVWSFADRLRLFDNP